MSEDRGVTFATYTSAQLEALRQAAHSRWIRVIDAEIKKHKHELQWEFQILALSEIIGMYAGDADQDPQEVVRCLRYLADDVEKRIAGKKWSDL